MNRVHCMNRLILAFLLTFCCHVCAQTRDFSAYDVYAWYREHPGAEFACLSSRPTSQSALPGTFVDCPSSASKFSLFHRFTSTITIIRRPDFTEKVQGSAIVDCSAPPILVNGRLVFYDFDDRSRLVGTLDISGMNVGDTRTIEAYNAGFIRLEGTAVNVPALECAPSNGSTYPELVRLNARYEIKSRGMARKNWVTYVVEGLLPDLTGKPDFTMSPTYVRCVGDTSSGCMTEPVTISVKDVTEGHRIQIKGLVTGGDLSYISNTGRVELPEGKGMSLVNAVSTGGIQQLTSGRFVIPGGGVAGTRFYTVNYIFTLD